MSEGSDATKARIQARRNQGDHQLASIEDRQKALENKFAHDQELKFRAEGRRNKLIGQWAAGLLGKADADAYALEVIEADLKQAGDEDVFLKLRGDFDAADVSVSNADIRAKMVELLASAVEQVNAV
jgi:hypothetical protein